VAAVVGAAFALGERITGGVLVRPPVEVVPQLPAVGPGRLAGDGAVEPRNRVPVAVGVPAVGQLVERPGGLAGVAGAELSGGEPGGGLGESCQGVGGADLGAGLAAGEPEPGEQVVGAAGADGDGGARGGRPRRRGAASRR